MEIDMDISQKKNLKDPPYDLIPLPSSQKNFKSTSNIDGCISVRIAAMFIITMPWN